MKEGKTVLAEMATRGIIKSFAEGRRLVFSGGVFVNGKPVDNMNEHLVNGDSVRTRRHSFIIGDDNAN